MFLTSKNKPWQIRPVSYGVTCRGFTLEVGHAHYVVGDGVLRESLGWQLDYIACNSERPNKICNRNIKKNVRGDVDKGYPAPMCTSSTGRPHPPEGNFKAGDEAKVGDQEGEESTTMT
jgi:hypothetical protein